jgi:sulfate adenylyltransferase
MLTVSVVCRLFLWHLFLLSVSLRRESITDMGCSDVLRNAAHHFLSLYSSHLEAAKQVPHGGVLVDLMCQSDEEKEAAVAKATVEIQATPRQLCDVELIMNGGFSPLTGFMDEETYKSVVENMELPDGTVFGLPVVLDTDSEELQPGTTVLLKDGDRPIATVEITDKYVPNKPLECLHCYGTASIEHPGALMVATERGKYYLGGKVTGLNLPIRDFVCHTPKYVRETLPDDVDVVAFQCRNPVHRARLGPPNLRSDSSRRHSRRRALQDLRSPEGRDT